MLSLAPARRHHGKGRPARRRGSRSILALEALETRQLLATSVAAPDLSQLTAQTNLTLIPMASLGPTGFSPSQIQTAYGVNQIQLAGGVTGNGAGQTIAIVDAYNDPNIVADLAKFDSQYGLSAPPSFTVQNLGATSTNASWALETSLDVEWAHALAPKAKLVLVEAASSSLTSLFGAVSAASQTPGVGVVSMSWGTPEFWGQWNLDSLFTTPVGHTNITYVASSGDSGAWSGPMYPSVSPNVLAVGGTSLTLGTNNTYGSETGWSGSTGGFSGTDNGFYFYEPAPAYQVAAQQAVGLNYGVRTTPDVSFNADPNTGVAVYDSVSYSGQSGWFDVGGTSAAAPAWAGLVAITDQGLAAAGKGTLSTNQLSTALYNLPSSDFHDITTGYNGYFATPGYDLVTGLGSPRANLVVAGLLSASGVSSPTNVAVVTAATVTTGHGHRDVDASGASAPTPTNSPISPTTATVSAITTATVSATSITTTAVVVASPAAPASSASAGSSSSVVVASQSASLAAESAPASTTAVGQAPMASLESGRLTREKTTVSNLVLDASESRGGVVHEEPSTEAKPSRGPDAVAPPTTSQPPLAPRNDAPVSSPNVESQSTPPAPAPPAPARPTDEQTTAEPGTMSGLVIVLGASALALRGHRSPFLGRGRDRRAWLPGPVTGW